MIDRFLHRQIARFERRYDYDMSYGHELLDISRPAFLRFARVTGMSTHREAVPLDAWYAAKLVATLAEDCGPCTQLATDMARQDGVDPTLLSALVEGNEAGMSEDARLGWRFARAVLAHDSQADMLRERIVERWDKRALVSLASVLAASRVYPTLKYALGHGRACTRVHIDGVATQPPLPA
ncbi:MAG: hypothetical protein ACT4PZ_22675 [Panacagrimonas sp.]